MANKFLSVSEAADWTLRQFRGPVVMATPLGLGKPNPLVNALYQRFKDNPGRRLTLFTALSLAVPETSNLLEQRLLGPFSKRQWGDDYPQLEYLKDLASGTLPSNIRIHEFYLQAGKSLDRPTVQRDYISVNYTHVGFAIADRGVNLLVQMIAKSPRRPGYYSLSCNPDLSLDVVDLYRKLGRKLVVVGMVHPDLPYCASDAEVKEDFFDAVVEDPTVQHQLFALPRQPISDADYLIGLQASLLVEDAGTLQIGIGSLSEALVYCMILRHQNNAVYRAVSEQLLRTKSFTGLDQRMQLDPFATGLYGTSEMVMDGFMHLRRAGILKREIFDLDESIRCYLHGAFFLGSKEFYQWLRELDEREETGLCMTRVSKVNDLYDPNELAIRQQRVKARFFNTGMTATLLGGMASDTKENGQVVSGVGGQFNFVAMSHELPDSYSVLMLRALRHSTKALESGFVWGQGQLTIARHLRDVVISEYGIAFLKNRTDEEVIQAQLVLADVHFQSALQQQAVRAGKLSPHWRLPEWTKGNVEGWPESFLQAWKAQGLFPAFPFGSDFTPVEERLVAALTRLKKARSSKAQMLQFLMRGLGRKAQDYREPLERMQLFAPKSLPERFYRRLLLGVF